MSLRKEKMARKKKEILRTAADVLAEKGYANTTMEDIASTLLMTKGAMYYYFKNKDDLLFQCHQMIAAESSEKIQEIVESDMKADEKLRAAITAHVRMATNERSIFLVIDKPNQTFSGEYLENIKMQRKEYARCFDKILRDGIEQGVFDQIDIPMVRLIILGALNSIQHWYSPDGGRSPEEISTMFSHYLLRTVLKKGE